MLVEIFELAQAAALPPVSDDAAKGREGMGPLAALGLAENILAHGTPLFVRWTLTISCNRPILVRNRNVIVTIEFEAITFAWCRNCLYTSGDMSQSNGTLSP